MLDLLYGLAYDGNDAEGLGRDAGLGFCLCAMLDRCLLEDDRSSNLLLLRLLGNASRQGRSFEA